MLLLYFSFKASIELNKLNFEVLPPVIVLRERERERNCFESWQDASGIKQLVREVGKLYNSVRKMKKLDTGTLFGNFWLYVWSDLIS